jgi:hypothetical protein
MARDAYDYDDEGFEPKRRDNLFLWTVLILLLIGTAFACWMGSFYVFGHPEEPRSYRILKKLKKIEQPRRFDVTRAPQGDFLSAQRAFERYSSKKSLELQKENAELLRIYIKNYTETKKLVPYLRGKFEVIETRELTSNDLFPSGTVALMQSIDFPQVVVEHLFPSSGSNLEESKRLLVPGVPFPIEKTNDVVTILHIERLADGRMLLTLVPLHYPSYALRGGAGTFAIEPPTELNIEKSLPIWQKPQLEASLKRHAQLKENAAPAADPTEPSTIPSGPEVVRLDTLPLGQTAPETGTLPEPMVAKAEPVRPLPVTPRPRVPDLALNTARATPLPVTTARTPIPVAPAIPFATPAPIAVMPPTAAPTPAPVIVAPPTPAPRPVASANVPLKPFVESNQGVVPQSETGANWRVYPAGQAPRGKTVTASEAISLAEQPPNDRTYLRGDFYVSAMGDNKAVLRPRGEGAPSAGSVRIIAEFPNGAPPPPEGTTFSRDSDRGFQVMAVSKASDGQVNVFVREVTRQQ